MVVGSSVGALNGAYYAGIHAGKAFCSSNHLRGFHRHDFSRSHGDLLGFIWRGIS